MDQDQPAGDLEVRTDDNGLFVRARVSHSVAKCCTYFSVAATVHQFRLRDIDDRAKAHALVTSSTLDEVNLVCDAANSDAPVRATPPRMVCAMACVRTSAPRRQNFRGGIFRRQVLG